MGAGLLALALVLCYRLLALLRRLHFVGRREWTSPKMVGLPQTQVVVVRLEMTVTASPSIRTSRTYCWLLRQWSSPVSSARDCTGGGECNLRRRVCRSTSSGGTANTMQTAIVIVIVIAIAAAREVLMLLLLPTSPPPPPTPFESAT